MKTEVLSAQDENALHHAAVVLRTGGLVAFPTDTVYGVAAPVFQESAVQRLYTVKGRSTDKAIAVLLAHNHQLASIAAALTPSAETLAAHFWPGPLTLVVPKHAALPRAVSSLPTVGVRRPNHAVAQRLLELTGPLAVTSANRSGEANTLSAQDVLAQLDGRIELVIDGGRVQGGVPSTVVDCTAAAPAILREGPISAADIAAALRSAAGPG